ncbi:MAG: hypothetical protein L0Z62_31025 [Gemmataceae bacterium]|nr:hypothetical protein [Gemmataceae bacterium]
MTATAGPPLPADQLERQLQATDQTVFLVSPRVLRRVIKRHSGAAGFGPLLPHGHSYVLDADALTRLVDPGDLLTEPGQPLPPKVILLQRPDPQTQATLTPGQILVRWWRYLFHARVHVALDQKIADDKLTQADVRRRIECLGQTELDEIRTVLRRERALLPPADDRTVYVEFVAIYLELRHFAPEQLPLFFPALTDFPAVDSLVADDVDGVALFAATRPADAPDPASMVHEHGETAPAPRLPAIPAEIARELSEQAREAAARGNVVRAAILRAQAAAGSVPDSAEAVAVAASELSLLASRLQRTLQLTDAQAEALSQALPPLLTRAALGGWTVEARLLYDLQKACIDDERGIFKVQPFRWAFSLGRLPLKRPMPNERLVLIYRHVRSAYRKIDRTHLTEHDRNRLLAALGEVQEHSAGRLRDHFRPLLSGTLDRVGLVPANLPERVARDKLVEELLDRVVGKGFLTLSDMRDAISRNQLKLDDLASPVEFIRGDKLLQLNRELAAALDGAYRPGEVYLRWLQSLSSLGFGTLTGRLLVRFLLLPFGVAFVALVGLDYLIEEGGKIGRLLAGTSAAHGEQGHHLTMPSPWALGGLALFLLLVFNVAPFRRGVGRGLRLAWRGVRVALIDAPLWVLRRPVVRAVWQSAPVRLFFQYLLVPLLLTGATAGMMLHLGLEGMTTAGVSAAVFVASALVLNTRFGRDLQEILTDRAERGWQRLSSDLIPGLFRLIMNVSRWFLETVDRLLYTVDEWLRFRTGESRLALIAKGLLGSVWFCVTYVVRIYTNLLVEPTVNPIKHFPVVTVGHKLMLPALPMVFNALQAPTEPLLGGWLATAFAGVTLFFVPGIFGFVAWELKENWKLYRANRAAELRPVMVGSHGETVLRLLRPGFHLGTVPKLFAKLRKAERKGRHTTAHKYHEGLHHAEEEVSHFVEREFLHLLAQSKLWGGLRLELRAVGLATNRIRLALACPEASDEVLEIALDHRAGWLVAGVTRPGWLGRLEPEQRQALGLALAGLYKRAGVDLTRELLFREVPLTWDEWVQAWERDQAGQAPAPVVEERRLLPVSTGA